MNPPYRLEKTKDKNKNSNGIRLRRPPYAHFCLSISNFFSLSQKCLFMSLAYVFSDEEIDASRLLGQAIGVNNQLFTSPHTTGDPEPAVDELGVAFICRLDSGESPKAVLSRIDVLLGFPGA